MRLGWDTQRQVQLHRGQYESDSWWDIGRVVGGHLQNQAILFVLHCRTAAADTRGIIRYLIGRRGRARRRGQIIIVVLALQQSHDRAAQGCGEDGMLEGRPAFALHVVRDRAGRTPMCAVPSVLLIERLGARVAQSRTDLNVPVEGNNVVLLVALVLDAEVVRQAAMTVKGAASVW